MKELPEEIQIEVDDKKGMVNTDKYIKSKTGDLREFGYNDLTETAVREQLLKILNNEELDVIGMFIEKDIIKGE